MAKKAGRKRTRRRAPSKETAWPRSRQPPQLRAQIDEILRFEQRTWGDKRKTEAERAEMEQARKAIDRALTRDAGISPPPRPKPPETFPRRAEIEDEIEAQLRAGERYK